MLVFDIFFSQFSSTPSVLNESPDYFIKMSNQKLVVPYKSSISDSNYVIYTSTNKSTATDKVCECK